MTTTSPDEVEYLATSSTSTKRLASSIPLSIERIHVCLQHALSPFYQLGYERAMTTLPLSSRTYHIGKQWPP